VWTGFNGTEEKKRTGDEKGKKREMGMEVGDGFGTPKNFGVAPPMAYRANQSHGDLHSSCSSLLIGPATTAH